MVVFIIYFNVIINKLYINNYSLLIQYNLNYFNNRLHYYKGCLEVF